MKNYLLETCSQQNKRPEFVRLVDEIPTLMRRISYYANGYGSSIYTDPIFIQWRENMKYSVRKLKSDDTTKDLLQMLDQFHGYCDEKILNKVFAICNIIKAHYEEYSNASMRGESLHMDTKKVFIVHGHNHSRRDEVELFLRRLKLDPVILDNEPNKGKTIIEKFEENSDVSFAVILYTACDEARGTEPEPLKKRARQNVLFEHGYFYAKLGRENVAALYEPEVELPSDLSGVLYIPFDAHWKEKLKQEMKEAGIESDWTIV